MQIRRADESHLAIARRAVDGNPELHEAVAGRINVIELLREVSEVSILAVFFLVPVIGEFNQRRAPSLRRLQQSFVFWRAQEQQCESALVIVDSSDLLQSQRVLIEFERGIEIADTQHGVEITHLSYSLEN